MIRKPPEPGELLTAIMRLDWPTFDLQVSFQQLEELLCGPPESLRLDPRYPGQFFRARGSHNDAPERSLHL